MKITVLLVIVCTLFGVSSKKHSNNDAGVSDTVLLDYHRQFTYIIRDLFQVQAAIEKLDLDGSDEMARQLDQMLSVISEEAHGLRVMLNGYLGEDEDLLSDVLTEVEFD